LKFQDAITLNINTYGGDGDNYNGWDTDDEEAEQKKIDEAVRGHML